MSAEQQPRKVRREVEISFSKQDAARLHHPHDDVLVITPLIRHYNTQRMLVDNGSAVNILFASTFGRMNLDETDLKPASFPLYGFTGDHLLPKGTISLSVTLGDLDKVTKVTEFLVVDYPSAFNGILGQPLLRQFKVVTSIYHLKMKFPTLTGIGEVSGSQRASRDCYVKAVQMTCKGMGTSRGSHRQAMAISRIEPRPSPAEDNIDPRVQDCPSSGPVEGLTEVLVDQKEPSRVLRIGKNLNP
ncbi:uncharacterized protein LOC116128468 [Pistacia vera]|uniref:uncharacterized protein LOC116128468 n=1 Tax=Pistacia vera TaxID=55513 RepID=UPI0012637CC3|nr:uncharacterized protein LOC116128468 [Pistacia vera]